MISIFRESGFESSETRVPTRGIIFSYYSLCVMLNLYHNVS